MKHITAIYIGTLILYILNDETFGQSIGDYCFKEYDKAISMIRIQSNNTYEYRTLRSEHSYKEIIQKGVYQLTNESIKFTIKEQFVNKVDSLLNYPIEVYSLAGYIWKKEIRIGNKESFLPYKKCTCATYRRTFKKLQTKTK